MKFRCQCGHVVVDDGRFEHIRGQILRAESFESVYEGPSKTIADFISAVAQGQRKEWIARFYGKSDFDLPDHSVVFDIINYSHLRSGLDIYQCEACGRIFIETAPEAGTYRSFKPDDEEWKGTLSDKSAARDVV